MTEPDPQLAMTELRRGIEQFNTGQYYHCHDTLEAIWMVAPIAEKPFYQGILQIAVGLHHLGNQNWRGAVTLLGEGVNRLYRFEPSYHQVNVTQLIDQSLDWLSMLQQLGPDQVSAIAETLVQVHRQEAVGKAAIEQIEPTVSPASDFPEVPYIQIDPPRPHSVS